MTEAEVKATLQAHRNDLEQLGVKSLELFGSHARGEQSAKSDIDLLVQFSRPIGLFAFYGVEEYLEKLFPNHKIDLVMRGAVLKELKETIYAEAIPCL